MSLETFGAAVGGKIIGDLSCQLRVSDMEVMHLVLHVILGHQYAVELKVFVSTTFAPTLQYAA